MFKYYNNVKLLIRNLWPIANVLHIKKALSEISKAISAKKPVQVSDYYQWNPNHKLTQSNSNSNPATASQCMANLPVTKL